MMTLDEMFEEYEDVKHSDVVRDVHALTEEKNDYAQKLIAAGLERQELQQTYHNLMTRKRRQLARYRDELVKCGYTPEQIWNITHPVDDEEVVE